MTCDSTSTPSVASSFLATRSGGDPCRGLAGARPLEHVSGVGEAILLHADEIGMARADLGERDPWWRPEPATSPDATCPSGSIRSS